MSSRRVGVLRPPRELSVWGGAIGLYKAHLEEVRRSVPAERLLVSVSVV